MFYSKEANGFFPAEMKDSYIAAGTWPADAVEITVEEHAALLAGQTAGQCIAADSKGKPKLIDRPPLSARDQALAGIIALETTITPRRLREAIIGSDNGWLAGVNQQIAALRTQL
jgi:hypothetical protein